MKILKKAAVLMTAAVMAVTALTVPASAAKVNKKLWRSMFTKQYNAIAVEATENTKLMNKLKKNEQYIYFISVSDGNDRADVTHHKGDKPNKAMRETALEARSKIDCAPLYVRLDIVDDIDAVTYGEFRTEASKKKECYYRYGIAFDENFETALLEQEVNANNIIEYETGKIILKNLNKYLKSQGQATLSKIPEQLYIFDCVSYFCDENGEVYELETGYYDQGRRKVEADADFVKEMTENTGAYLAGLIDEDGVFDYEKHPIEGVSADDYNIVRHAGTAWNLILEYSISRDRSLLAPINRAMDYMVERMEYVGGKAYFLDDYSRASAGGNGLAAVAFADYARYINKNRYKDVAYALGDSLIGMMNDDGSINHIYKYKNGQVTLTKAFSCVYYDGEAALALAKLYTSYGEQKYLDAACSLADYFIASKYDDGSNVHWIAYSMNEITKHVPEVKYFKFGLNHIAKYMTSIGKSKTNSSARYESLVASFEMYDRMKQKGIYVKFDIEKLLEAIAKRTDFGYNYYMFPEVAMYFANPSEIMYGFAVREASFRMRIDDTQHFMGGYCSYYYNYSALSEYMAEYLGDNAA